MLLPIHYSWPVSPYSAKTRAYLRFKGILFEDRAPTVLQLRGRIQKAVGRAIMPTILLPDGTWLQDSARIIDHFESLRPEPSVQPLGPTQRLASGLLTLLADEWLPMAALHYRWNRTDNAAFAIDEFARWGAPWLPRALARPLARPVAERMMAYRPKLGITPATAPGIEATATAIIAALDAHLASHAFVLGDRPCVGDFALYGPLWAHLFRDPGTTALFDRAPHVRRWMTGLTDGDLPPGAFLADDAVPAGLAPLFLPVFAELWPYLCQVNDAARAWLEAQPDGPGVLTRLPRALGDGPFTIGGVSGTRRLITFGLWKAQRVLDLRDGARPDWLAGVGVAAFGSLPADDWVRQRFEGHRLMLAAGAPCAAAPPR